MDTICKRFISEQQNSITVERKCQNKCSKKQIKTDEKIFYITKTYLYKFDPFKPHFYKVKLGFTGVYIIFLFLLKNIDCGYSLDLIVLGFNDTSTLEGHFVSSPREREKRDKKRE